MWRERALSALKIAVVIGCFMLASYYTQAHKEYLAEAIRGSGAIGPISFVLITAALVVVLIPIDLVFILPLGIALWGPVAAASLSILGWTIGAAVAFGIARYWGRPLVVRIIGERRVEVLEKRVPTTNLFPLVVLLRMCIPVDLLSYALGLASTLSWRAYILATVLGVAPFAFFFAYAGTLPLAHQLVALLAAFGAAAVILVVVHRYRVRPLHGPDDDQSHAARVPPRLN